MFSTEHKTSRECGAGAYASMWVHSANTAPCLTWTADPYKKIIAAADAGPPSFRSIIHSC